MAPVGDHSKPAVAELAGRPLRLARTWAWAVFWLTAGSSVLYNCYHALVGDHMPWYTGIPEGCVPLAVAIGVLEFSGAWRENKALQASAWLVTGGAMAWSALAINSVVHRGWAFGLIADAAAMSAMYFLLNGPTAAHAVGEVARTVSSLTERADAERAARRQAEAAHRAQAEQASARHAAEVSALRSDLTGKLEAERSARETAHRDLEAARAELAGALDRAEALAAKLSAVSAQRKRPQAAASGRARGAGTADGDPTNELRAVMELRADPDLRRPRMGGELARRLGLGASTGRRLHSALVKDGALSEYAESLIAPTGERSQ